MKVILNVSENWYRKYLVEIPDNTPPEKFDDEAIAAYLSWLRGGAEQSMDWNNPSYVAQFSDPDYVDDAPSDTFFVEGPYVE